MPHTDHEPIRMFDSVMSLEFKVSKVLHSKPKFGYCGQHGQLIDVVVIVVTTNNSHHIAASSETAKITTRCSSNSCGFHGPLYKPWTLITTERQPQWLEYDVIEHRSPRNNERGRDWTYHLAQLSIRNHFVEKPLLRVASKELVSTAETNKCLMNENEMLKKYIHQP